MGIGKWGNCSAMEWLRCPEPLRWRRTYSGRGDQVAAARDFAGSLFAGTGREGDAELIVSELAGNAIRHTRSAESGGWFGLEVVFDNDLARVAVTDLGGGGFPTVWLRRASDELEVNRRGLLLVTELAVAIGVHGSPAGGHTVWADIEPRAKTGTSPVRMVLPAP